MTQVKSSSVDNQGASRDDHHQDNDILPRNGVDVKGYMKKINRKNTTNYLGSLSFSLLHGSFVSITQNKIVCGYGVSQEMFHHTEHTIF